jgi:hypothetical protein
LRDAELSKMIENDLIETVAATAGRGCLNNAVSDRVYNIENGYV